MANPDDGGIVMTMSIKSARQMLLLSAMCLIVPLTPSIAYAKKPDCSINSSHPSCGGDDGGGSETTCATSETFPTFAYWEDQGQSTITVLSLSDAEGACTAPLTEFDTEHFLVGETAFYFDPVTRSGRVVWTNHFIADYLFLVEFDVGDVNASNAVDVWNDSQAIVALPGIDHAKGTMRNLDIGLDGDLLAFIYRPPKPEGTTGGYTIYTASIDGCSFEPWTPPDATGCNNTLVEIISADPVPEGTYYWNEISLSTDNSKIYLNQFINALGGGTYVIDLGADEWVLTRLEKLPFPSDIALLDHDQDEVQTEVLATSGTSEANPCGELIVVDIEDCLEYDYCDSLDGHNINILGANPSWLWDGRLVYQDRFIKRQGKNHSCRTGDISITDPLDPISIPDNLIEGREPRGWQ